MSAFLENLLLFGRVLRTAGLDVHPGRVLDLIHQLNTMRKEAGLELTDRIRVTLPQADADLLAHEQWIKEEVLATEIATDGDTEPQITKV